MSKAYVVVRLDSGLHVFRSEKTLTGSILAEESMIGGSLVVIRDPEGRVRRRGGKKMMVFSRTTKIVQTAWMNRVYRPCFCGLHELFKPGDPKADATPKLTACDFEPGDVIKIFAPSQKVQFE